MVFVFIVIGFLTGIASGLLGIGGGIFFIPALFFLLPEIGVHGDSLTYHVIATSLFAGSFSSTSSFMNHLRRKNIELKKGALLATGSITAAILVSQYAVDISPTIIRSILGGMLSIVAVQMFFSDKIKYSPSFVINENYLFLVGLVVGTLSALSGIGGGVFYLPILLIFFSADMRKSVGTSSMTVAMTMISLSISFAMVNHGETSSSSLGLINLTAGLPLGLAAIIGASIGSKLVFKVSPVALKKIFSIFLLLAVIKILAV